MFGIEVRFQWIQVFENLSLIASTEEEVLLFFCFFVFYTYGFTLYYFRLNICKRVIATFRTKVILIISVCYFLSWLCLLAYFLDRGRYFIFGSSALMLFVLKGLVSYFIFLLHFIQLLKLIRSKSNDYVKMPSIYFSSE